MIETISLFDNDSKLLVSEPGKNYRRISMTGAANQRRLDELAKLYPMAVVATIGTCIFKLQDGLSSWLGYNSIKVK